MKTTIYLFCFFFLIVTLSCRKQTNSGEFDTKEWKNDPGGCKGKRIKFKDELLKIKESFKGQAQREVVKILGTPDYTNLYVRNQQFYYYYISPGKKCRDSVYKTTPVVFFLRFNALGRVNEVGTEFE